MFQILFQLMMNLLYIILQIYLDIYGYSENITTWSNSSESNTILINFKDAEISGNIETLINENSILSAYCFKSLFEGGLFISIIKDLLFAFTIMSVYFYQNSLSIVLI